MARTLLLLRGVSRIFWLVLSLLVVACGGELDADESGADDNNKNDDPYHYDEGCFVAGTRIATPTGTRPIETLKVGDLVQAFDLATQRVVTERVTATYVHEQREVGFLNTVNGPVLLTANHPIYEAASQRFIPAGSLLSETASLVLASNGSTRSDLLGPFVLLPAWATVYNISVADVETYFAEGLLVHNKSRCGYPGHPADCGCYDGDPHCSFEETAPLGITDGGAGGVGGGPSPVLGGVGGIPYGDPSR